MLSIPTETVRAYTSKCYWHWLELWQPTLCAGRSLHKAACPTLDRVEAEMTVAWEAGHDWLPCVWSLCTWCKCSWQNSCKDWLDSSYKALHMKRWDGKTRWGRLDWKPALISVTGSMWIGHRVVLTSSEAKVLCIALIRDSPRSSVSINRLWVAIWSWLAGLLWDWTWK